MSKTLKLEMLEKVQLLALTSPDRTTSTAEPWWQGAEEQRPGYHLHTHQNHQQLQQELCWRD